MKHAVDSLEKTLEPFKERASNTSTRHKGKLPKAVVGEILHVINNKLSSIILNANSISHDHAAKIEEAAHFIADYVRSFKEKEDWNSNPFEKDDEAA